MPRIRKELILVGDRVLVRPQKGEERTGGGLYLPQTAVNEQQVRGGRIVKVGPGIPVAEPMESEEPWRSKQKHEPRYLPLQAREGDYALFLKNAAIEIDYEGEKFLIVPNSALLALAREDIDLGDEFG